MNNHQPPHKPPPAPIRFTIVVLDWVKKHRRVVLQTNCHSFIGTLAGAKATLTGKIFFTAKIYELEHGCEELVATVRGTQTRQHPIPKPKRATRRPLFLAGFYRRVA